MLPGECLSSGASSAAPEPSTTISALPHTSEARVMAVCMSGRPETRTSCLGEPKRVEAPAASTIAYSPSPALAALSIAYASACRGVERGACRQPLARARETPPLLQNAVRVDAADGAPVGDARIAGQQGLQRIAPRAPRAVEVRQERRPAGRCTAACEGRLQLLERLAAAAAAGEHLLERTPGRIVGAL